MIENRLNYWQKALIVLPSLLLMGCVDSYTSNTKNIDQLIAESKQRAERSSNVTVEDLLPMIEGDDHTQYGGIAYTDPFTIPSKISNKFIETDLADSSTNIVLPLESDPTRPAGYKKGPLESYDLVGLRMIGTIGLSSGELSALIDTGEDRIVTIYVGDYIGMNYGEVIDIQEGYIEISEKYAANTEKGWISRPAFINLSVKD